MLAPLCVVCAFFSIMVGTGGAVADYGGGTGGTGVAAGQPSQGYLGER